MVHAMAISFIPSDLIESPRDSAPGAPRGLFEPHKRAPIRRAPGMVGGDAVALTVPEVQRALACAGSDLLPSDFSVTTFAWWLVC